MKLAIFDIDGTLTRTYEADQVCFAQAFQTLFALTGPELTDWTHYATSTDTGITDEIFRERKGRPPTDAETDQLQADFMARLEQAWRETPEAWGETPGAQQILARLDAAPDWAIAVATGCREASARFKLRVAGLDLHGAPIACSDTMIHRADIVRFAIDTALKRYEQEQFDGIVYIGDGLWDLRAARELKLGFLGIGTGPRADALRKEGAAQVMQDFSDPDAIMTALENAAAL